MSWWVAVPHPQTTWAPVGSHPLSDAQAARLVAHRPENRPGNQAANNYFPTDSELQKFHSYDASAPDSSYQRQFVTGRSTLHDPSTDDLIQWVAHKWGIPEDWIRAEMVVESRWAGIEGWNQNSMGDRTTVSREMYSQYPPQARIPGTNDVYESMGIASVKWIPDGTEAPGAEPLRWESTAFNLDYYTASVRYYYDGDCIWCTSGYAAGQPWNSIGAWYEPQPWNNSLQQTYIGWVQTDLDAAPWTRPGF